MTGSAQISPATVLSRAVNDLLAQMKWPYGPAIVAFAWAACTGLSVSLAEHLGADPISLAALASAVMVAVIAVLFVVHIALAGYRIQAERANAAEGALRYVLDNGGSLDDEQLERIVARYYGSAHTFLSFNVASRVSVSQNVESVELRDTDTVVVRFLQPLEPRSVLVRPVGGTPRIDIVALDSRSVTLKLALPTDIIRLRIFGDIVPQLRNHGPGSDPVAIAARRRPLHRAGEPILLHEAMRADITT